jgi:hypothetical protein
MLTLYALVVVLNLRLTPGVVRSVDVCSVKWGLDRRHVTQSMKREVLRRYGLPLDAARFVEFDHLIPRELGGADDVRNLWPQPWPDAHKKDVAENRLHRAVCSGSISLLDAQNTMRHWKRIKP